MCFCFMQQKQQHQIFRMHVLFVLCNLEQPTAFIYKKFNILRIVRKDIGKNNKD